ncbi:MAG: glutathione S-transferase N-terminal domain-containing protein [Novosphingobium sp.]
MQLYASATSPYARKVRIGLIELGLSERVRIVPTAPTENAAYRQVAPLGKIPALRLDDGSVIYDSLVILDWLDHFAGGGRLIPVEATARNAELRRHALANGIIDAAFNIAMELRRPEEGRSSFWIGRWSDAIEAAAEVLPAELPDDLTLSSITAVCAADYVAFRLADLRLDTGRLSAWRKRLSPSPSLEHTFPQLELT